MKLPTTLAAVGALAIALSSCTTYERETVYVVPVEKKPTPKPVVAKAKPKPKPVYRPKPKPETAESFRAVEPPSSYSN